MTQKGDQHGQTGPRKQASKRTDRAMELMWAESLTKAPAPPAVPDPAPILDDILDVLLVPEDEIVAAKEPGPFIEAMLAPPISKAEPAPFIPAVVVETAPINAPTPVNVSDWLADIAPAPTPVPPPPPPVSATPDWLTELADTGSPPPPAAGPRPDWLDNLP